MNGNDAVRGDAGRELDVRVAVEVLGWPIVGTSYDPIYDRTVVTDIAPPDGRPGLAIKPGSAVRFRVHPGREVPALSTDIAAAWKVVAAMREHPDVRRRTLRLVAYSYNRTYATFDAEADSEEWSEGNGEHATPLAICRAALAATAESVTPNPRSFVAEPAAPHAVPSEEGEG